MVPCEGCAAHAAGVCRGRSHHFPDDDLDLVNTQKRECRDELVVSGGINREERHTD